MPHMGIDVGTAATRVLVMNEQGKVLHYTTVEHPPFTTFKSGWVEQNPEDWWQAACQAIREVFSRDRVAPEAITAIGLCGQMHGSVLLDVKGTVVRPALLWCDQRTDEQCRGITEKIGRDRLIQLTCNPALTGFTLPKVLWVRENEPQEWKQVHKILLPKDYIRFRLSGQYATDVSDASGTLLLDVANRRWSGEMLTEMELASNFLPSLYESTQITGTVSESGAAETGLLKGTPIVAGAGDQAALAVSMGIVLPGAVSANIGNSGVVFAATDRPALDPGGRVHTFCHAVPERWHVMGVTQAAGLSLRWARNCFHDWPEEGGQVYDRLFEEAAAAPPGSDGLLWNPYLLGERTPHLDPFARASLVGLTAYHTRGHVIRSILEGVAFSLRDSFQIFEEMEVPVCHVRLGGFGAQSPLWRQIQADIYGHTVEVVECEEGAVYGAALLAGVGIGTWPSVDSACAAAVRVAHTINPESAGSKKLNRQYQAYRSIYSALRNIYAGLARD